METTRRVKMATSGGSTATPALPAPTPRSLVSISQPPQKKLRFMYFGEHGVEMRERGDRERERERERRLHSRFAVHALRQWAMQGDMIKKMS